MGILILFAGIVIGWIFGWGHAHFTVAAECERLGGFFVGKQVYECTAVKPKEDSQ